MRRWMLLFLLLGACSAPHPAALAPQTMVYDCGGGYRMTLQRDGEGARLLLPGGTRRVGPAGTPGAYRADGISLRLEDKTAQLEIAGQIPRTCRADRAAAIWEDARLRGVDFRAVGGPPGWYLEIGPRRIRYAGDFGREILDFPASAAQVDTRVAQTRYRGAVAGHRFEALLEPGDCYERLSGKHFATRVTLKLDGRTLYGCGRPLH